MRWSKQGVEEREGVGGRGNRNINIVRNICCIKKKLKRTTTMN